MSDNVTHLEFIYNRMVEVHGENKNYDYMLRFASIIEELHGKPKRKCRVGDTIVIPDFDSSNTIAFTVDIIEWCPNNMTWKYFFKDFDNETLYATDEDIIRVI